MNERTKSSLLTEAAWVALHFYTSIHAFLRGLYQTYTGMTWVALSIWLLGLLALDARLVSGGPGRLRFAKWYWGFSAALAAGAVLAVTLDLTLGLTLVIGALCSILTPLNQLLAFSWLLFEKLAGLKGSIQYVVEWSAILLFCLLHFAYITWLHRRAQKRGGMADGPVVPGTGTVE